jgi:hypothetical protein
MVVAWTRITKALHQMECLPFDSQVLLQIKTVVFAVKTGVRIQNVP